MRIVSIVVLCTALACPAFAATPGRLEYEVLRNGEPFGRHIIEVSVSGEDLNVQSHADLRVSLGPVPVFRYEQSCTESWRRGVLVGLRCSTLRDGRRTRIEGRSNGGRILVSGAHGETTFPLGALPTSWWIRPANTLRSMIDTETGALMPVRVTYMGRDTIDIGGTPIHADRVRVQGSLAVDLWYDFAGRWIGCAFTAHGQRVSYRLVTAIAAAPIG